MPTPEQIEAVRERIESLEAEKFGRDGDGNIRVLNVRGWGDLNETERKEALVENVAWSGFNESEEQDVIRRVVGGESPDLWMDGIEPSDPPGTLAAELQADSLAARVRDYGPEDAATYDRRVRDGAELPATDHGKEFASMMEAIANPPDFARDRPTYEQQLDDSARMASLRTQDKGKEGQER